jgi:hypothetical protein
MSVVCDPSPNCTRFTIPSITLERRGWTHAVERAAHGDGRAMRLLARRHVAPLRRVNTHRGRVNTHRGRVNTHRGRVNTHRGRVNTHRGRVNTHRGRVNTHRGRVNTHRGRVNTHRGRVNTHRGRVNTHRGRLTHTWFSACCFSAQLFASDADASQSRFMCGPPLHREPRGETQSQGAGQWQCG